MHLSPCTFTQRPLRKIFGSALSILLLIGALSCAKEQQVIRQDESINQKLLEFFWACERDLFTASQEISKESLIKNLTHLNKMATGGSHYYPLERDSITAMINKMSAHLYSECLIINKSGTIIYTMFSNDLLGKAVADFPISPLPQLFGATMKGEPDVTDAAIFPVAAEKKEIFFSVPITEKSEVVGIVVAAVRATDLVKRIPVGSFLVNADGIIQSDADNANILLPTVLPDLSAAQKQPMLIGGKRYYPFEFRNLHWVLVVPQK